LINTQKHIEYWRDSALSDIDTAELLFNKNKLKESLFFCHLTIEKILKAHYTKVYNEVPPKTHSLYYLVEKNAILTDENLLKLFGILMRYQMEGRYPEYKPGVLSKERTLEIIKKTKEVLKWLMIML
jgi:HEPN domain-containing protein